MKNEQTKRSIIARGSLALAMAVTLTSACGTMDDGTDPSAGDDQGTVLLDDQYSSTGRLRVVSDASGNLGVVVQGRIGTDDARVGMAAARQRSLVDTFASLHPGADIPPAVKVLSDRLAAQPAAQGPAQIDAPPAPASDASDASDLQDKSFSTFLSTACQTFTTWGWTFKPQVANGGTCVYGNTVHSVCTGNRLDPQDRSWAWNETPYSGKHSLSASTWKPVVPAWTWQYAQWGGSYSQANACLTLDGASSVKGNLGITHHNAFAVIY